MTSISFEYGYVLPATTQLKIFSSSAFNKPLNTFNATIKTDNGDFILLEIDVIKGGVSHYKLNGEEINPYNLETGFIIDTSSWTIEKRTVSSITWQLTNGTTAAMWYKDIAPPSYTITFNSNGGTTVSPISDVTEIPSPLPTTTKSGYTFVNWYYDSVFTQIATAGDTIESNVTLYAKWQLTTYTITFNSNGGTTVSPISDVTEIPSPLPTTTRLNHVFAGWYYDTLFTQKANAGDILESNVTLYAKWYSVSGWFSDVADAIRTKDGTAETIEVVEFPDRIEALPSPKEEETKTVTPTTSSQDVLPDANKVLSKVTVNAIPTETKSATPSLGSGDQIIYQTSGKYMTAFTIVKDLTNHIAANIRYGKTLYGVAGSLVEGIDTSDANATSSSIHDGKTAYVNGSKITGTADLGVELTQTAYDNLNTKDSNTYYLIIEES